VLNLSLAENCLDNNVKDAIIDGESLSVGWVETFLRKKLPVANQHFSKLRDLTIQVVRCDLVKLQTNFLAITLLSSCLLDVLGGSRNHLGHQLIFLLSPFVIVDRFNDVSTSVESTTATAIAATATTTSTVVSITVSVVVVVSAVGSAAASATSVSIALVFTCGAVHSAFFLVNELLVLTGISSGNQATMD